MDLEQHRAAVEACRLRRGAAEAAAKREHGLYRAAISALLSKVRTTHTHTHTRLTPRAPQICACLERTARGLAAEGAPFPALEAALGAAFTVDSIEMDNYDEPYVEKKALLGCSTTTTLRRLLLPRLRQGPVTS